MQNKVFDTKKLFGRTPKRSKIELEAECLEDVVERQLKINTLELQNIKQKQQFAALNYINKENIYDMIYTAEIFREQTGFDILAETQEVDSRSPGAAYIEVDFYNEFIKTLGSIIEINDEDLFIELDEILLKIAHIGNLQNVFNYLYSPEDIDCQSLLARFDTYFMKKEIQECQTIFAIPLIYELVKQMAVIHYRVHQGFISNEQAIETEKYLIAFLHRYKYNFSYQLRVVVTFSTIPWQLIGLPTLDCGVHLEEEFENKNPLDFLKGKLDRNHSEYIKKIDETIKTMRPALMKSIQNK
jgi:hypothetical protein